MNHIFYQTKTKFTNTGDALINQALIETLRHYGKLYVNCCSDIPDSFIDELGISQQEKIIAQSEISFVKTVLECSKSAQNGEKIYIFSGLGDSFGGSLHQVIRNIMSSFIFAVFRLHQVKIVRIGRSIGPLTKLMQMSERLRSIFLTYNYVRDSKSLARCQSYGIKKVKYCPDMSWIYDEEGVRRINSTNTVMVNLRNSIFDDVEQDFIDATLKKLDMVLETFSSVLGCKMKIIVAYQIEEDAAFSKMVYERLKMKYNVEYINHQMKLDELEKYYRMVDYHISNRMHALLAGYKYGSLPVALIDAGEHTKISATLLDNDLEELMIHIYDSDEQEKVSKMINQRETMMKKLFDVESSNVKKIYAVLDGIFEQDGTIV